MKFFIYHSLNPSNQIFGNKTSKIKIHRYPTDVFGFSFQSEQTLCNSGSLMHKYVSVVLFISTQLVQHID